jgi:ketosteroid isomerase-like protein
MTRTPEEVAREYVRLWNTAEFEKMAATLFADDMVWSIRGYSPQSGDYSRDTIAGLLVKLPLLDTVEPFLLHIENITANDERAAVEMISTMKLRSGKEYKNQYHFLLFIKDGKITRGHEYLCTWTAVHHGIDDEIAKLFQTTAAEN